MKLTVETNQARDEIAIAFDKEGLELLMSKLDFLRSHTGHTHLMTPSWAGNELTEDIQGGPSYQLIHSLRLVRV
jgi:hypothetical protein